MIRVVVAGGCGRIGSEVARLVQQTEDMELIAILEHKDHPLLSTARCDVEVVSDLSDMLSEIDVVVEFTSPNGTFEVIKKLDGSRIPLVSGTTGLGEKESAQLKDEAKNRAVLWSPNMSVGVNLLFKLTAQATKALSDYDVEIVEMHHRHKKDAPSGTAKKLASIVKDNRKIEKIVYGREGQVGERTPDELAVLALRGGDVAGEHTVYFVTEGERIELTHRASSRLAFARGTLRAIRFIYGKTEGYYEYASTLEDQ